MEKTWNKELLECIVKKVAGLELKKGSQVRIRNNSEYSHQHKDVGVLVNNFGDSSFNERGAWARVRFENGYENDYRKQDLEHADSPSLFSEEIASGKIASGNWSNETISLFSEKIGVPRSLLKKCITGKLTDVGEIPVKSRRALYLFTGMQLFKPAFTLPAFEGKNFFVNNKRLKAGMLQGEFGEVVFDEYRNRIREYDKNLEKLLTFEDRQVCGSAPHAGVLINMILQPYGFGTATLKEMWELLEQKVINLGNFFSDAALVLRTQCDPNGKFSQYLVRHIKEQKGTIVYPSVISLADLELDKTYFGTAFKLKENGEVIPATQLVADCTKTFDRTDSNGLPFFSLRGRYYCSTERFGLLRAYYSGRKLCTNVSNLTDTNVSGRIIIVQRTS